MGDTLRIFGDFIHLALEHPEGQALARLYDRTFQFDLTDDEPFYLEIRAGMVTVRDGDCGLDWQQRDWERATCIHTSGAVLREIVAGRRLLSEAFFDRELGWSALRGVHRDTDATVEGSLIPWLCALGRLARAQGQAVARRRYLAEVGLAEE
jgi:hypothetical protein